MATPPKNEENLVTIHSASAGQRGISGLSDGNKQSLQFSNYGAGPANPLNFLADHKDLHSTRAPNDVEITCRNAAGTNVTSKHHLDAKTGADLREDVANVLASVQFKHNSTANVLAAFKTDRFKFDAYGTPNNPSLTFEVKGDISPMDAVCNLPAVQKLREKPTNER